MFFVFFCGWHYQEFNQSGMISKTKERRLLLLNDLLVCVTVVSKSGDDYRQNASERLTLKWAFPITDVEVGILLFDILWITELNETIVYTS